jgi:hypothetical protein
MSGRRRFADVLAQLVGEQRFDMVIVQSGGNDVIRLRALDALQTDIDRVADRGRELADSVVLMPALARRQTAPAPPRRGRRAFFLKPRPAARLGLRWAQGVNDMPPKFIIWASSLPICSGADGCRPLLNPVMALEAARSRQP